MNSELLQEVVLLSARDTELVLHIMFQVVFGTSTQNYQYKLLLLL